MTTRVDSAQGGFFEVQWNHGSGPRLVPTGTVERDRALAQVAAHADADWKVAALGAVYATACARATLTTDDVTVTGVRTHDPRAWGAVMKQAQARGWILPLDRHECSTVATAHRRPKRVWASQIHQELA